MFWLDGVAWYYIFSNISKSFNIILNILTNILYIYYNFIMFIKLLKIFNLNFSPL